MERRITDAELLLRQFPSPFGRELVLSGLVHIETLNKIKVIIPRG